MSKNQRLFFVSSLIASLFSSLAILSSSCFLFSILTVYSTFFNGLLLMFNNLLPYFSEYSSMYPFSTFCKLFLSLLGALIISSIFVFFVFMFKNLAFVVR